MVCFTLGHHAEPYEQTAAEYLRVNVHFAISNASSKRILRGCSSIRCFVTKRILGSRFIRAEKSMQDNLSLTSATLAPLTGLILVTHASQQKWSQLRSATSSFEPPTVTVHEGGTGEGKNADNVLQKLPQMAKPKSRLLRQHLFHLCMTGEVTVQ